MEEVERKNRRIAGLSTIGIHALLIVVMFFAVGWRAPNPPWEGSAGIELNFGLDDQGSGDVQPENPVGTTPEQTTTPTQDNPVQEEKKEQVTEPQSQEEQVTAKDETAVPVKDVKKDQPKEKPAEKTPEKPKEEPTKEVTKPGAVYNPNADSKATDAKTGQAGNHGDDPGKTGDKGNPQGTMRSDALYGQLGGGGGGPNLKMDGWFWDEKPNPVVPSDEDTGKIVFEITVDENGEVTKITTLTRGLSIEFENNCKKAIQRTTFSRTGNNTAKESKGTISFAVLSR